PAGVPEGHLAKQRGDCRSRCQDRRRNVPQPLCRRVQRRPALQKIPVTAGNTYQCNAASSYVQNPPFFEDIGQPPAPPADIENARILALFGDSITTDHISPAGNIKASPP